MTNIPKLKKKVTSFLTKEDGKISKKELIKAGIVITGLAIATTPVAAHTNTYTPDCPSITAGSQSSAHQNTLTLSYQDNATGSHDNCVETHSNIHGSGCCCMSW